MATIDPAASSAQKRTARKSTQKSVARAVKSGKSPIAGMGAIVAKARSKATSNGNHAGGPKVSETDHLRKEQFGTGTSVGRSAAGSYSPPAASQPSAKAPASRGMTMSGGYQTTAGKHAGGVNQRKEDSYSTASGNISYGRHSKEYGKG